MAGRPAAYGRPVKHFDDKVVAITGAGSGIGRALALDLAGQGAALSLCDVDEAGLRKTVERCTASGAMTTSMVVDVSDRDQVAQFATQTVTDHGRVNVIVNNAGVSLSASVARSSYADIEWLMGINFWGVVYGTKEFLPHLEASGDGHVVNISSVFGLTAIPTQSAYNAAKFAVRGFTDALRIELEADGSCVSATTIHPGGIKTSIVENGRVDPEGMSREEAAIEFEKIARTTPEAAASQIVKAVQRNRRRALIGPDAVVFDLVSRLPAALPQRLLARAERTAREGAQT